MSDTVDKVKERLSILEVVQPYVKLTRAGKYWKGLSPFTKEKTPSFFVTPDKGLYHCFSTGKGGDMFTFIEEMEGLDFKGALKLLAEKAGVELEYERPGARDERERLYAALDAAKDFFVEGLTTKADALAYLKGRGLTDESMGTWAVGYAPQEWQALHDILIKKGFTATELELAGLAKKAEREDGTSEPHARLYDRFRGRIMFPIRDIAGRVIGFSGRIFEDDAAHPQAKYLNSPETPLFDKSRALYGLDRARDGVRHLNAAILVEGQMDLLMMHQIGYKNAVATSGTAFTASHATLLKRYAPNLLIAYDGDDAGVNAAGRAAALALQSGMDVKIAKLPREKDPADLAEEDRETLKSAIKSALHVVDFYLAEVTEDTPDPRARRLEASRIVLPYITLIENRIDQAHFVERVASVLAVPTESVAAELQKIRPSPKAGAPAGGAPALPPEPRIPAIEAAERLVWGIALTFHEERSPAAEKASDVLRAAAGEERFKALAAASDDEKNAAMIVAAEELFNRFPAGSERERALESIYGDYARMMQKKAVAEKTRLHKEAQEAGDSERAKLLFEELNILAKEGQ